MRMWKQVHYHDNQIMISNRDNNLTLRKLMVSKQRSFEVVEYAN